MCSSDLNGSVSGTYDANTVAAVKAFQKKNGLAVDGAVGKKSLAILFSDGVLDADDAIPTPEPEPLKLPYKYGDKGSEIKKVQEKLLALGYKAGKADGVFGKNTRDAVKLFQARNGMTVDGKICQRTLERLLDGSAVPAEGAAAPVVPELPDVEEDTAGDAPEAVVPGDG